MNCNDYQELAHWPDHLILHAHDHHYFVDDQEDSDVDVVEGTEEETCLDEQQSQQLKENIDKVCYLLNFFYEN